MAGYADLASYEEAALAAGALADEVGEGLEGVVDG